MMRAEHPLIVSASRTTDIPAFHMPWFMHRLREGWCVRVNPFNSGQRTRIEFDQARAVVFWSKDPRPLARHLPEVAERGLTFYIQYTLNDYAQEGLEPGLPSLAVRLDTFKRLADAWGPERLVWRYDPLLLGASLGVEELLDRLDRIGREISPYTDTLTFSFLDLYAKCRARLRTFDPFLRPPDTEEVLRLAQGLSAINQTWPGVLRLTTCAEAVDVSEYGIFPGACIDAARLRYLCPDDVALAELCGERPGFLPVQLRRDKGQRPLCNCLPSKDVGAYNTCRHFCRYCYANHSEKTVFERLSRYDPASEALV